jgi:hypothetical protein
VSFSQHAKKSYRLMLSIVNLIVDRHAISALRGTTRREGSKKTETSAHSILIAPAAT